MMNCWYRLTDEDWPAGQSLPYPVYDGAGSLLYEPGVVIGSEGYLRFLIGRGLYLQLSTRQLENWIRAQKLRASSADSVGPRLSTETVGRTVGESGITAAGQVAGGSPQD